MSIDYNINLTDNALRKIYSLLEQERDKSYILRVAVSGGGCSGFKYNFLMDQPNKNLSLDDEFDNEYEDCKDSEVYKSYSNFNKKSEDIVINDKDGNPVLAIDNYSIKFLNNSVIDYAEDLSGSGFQVKSTIVKSKCGCGNSFSI